MSLAEAQLPSQRSQPEQQSVDASLVLLEVQDVLREYLSGAGCFGTARLVCRSLRSVVDDALESVTLTLSNNDIRLLEARQPDFSPLCRWPRCSKLTINWCGKHCRCAPRLPALLFAGVQPEALARVQDLTISAEVINGEESSLYIFSTVAALAVRLPMLQHLDISGCQHLPWSPSEGIFHMLYTTLATMCTQLESLALPCDADLVGVQALAGSLQRLALGTPSDRASMHSDEEMIPAASLRCIAQLRRLRELSVCFEDVFYDTDLGIEPLDDLLNGLPLSLERIELGAPRDGKDDHLAYLAQRLRLRMSGGKLTSINVDGGFGAFDDEMLDSLATVFLSPRFIGAEKLSHLDLQNVLISCCVTEEDVPHLVDLVRLCGRATVDSLNLPWCNGDFGDPDPDGRAEAAVTMARLLGMPRTLRLISYTSAGAGVALQLRLQTSDTSEPAAAAATAATNGARTSLFTTAMSASGPESSAAAGPEATAASQGPSTCDGASAGTAATAGRSGGAQRGGQGGAAAVLGTVLGTASAEDVLRVALERLWTSGSGTDAQQTPSGGDQVPHRVVMVQGPPIPNLEEGPLIPNLEVRELALQLWVQGLEGPSRRNGAGEEGVLRAYMGFLGVRPLLVECASPEAAARIVAGRDTGGPSGSGTFELEGQGTRAVQLPYDNCHDAVMGAMQPVLQELWDNSAGAGLGELVRLGALVKLLAEVDIRRHRSERRLSA